MIGDEGIEDRADLLAHEALAALQALWWPCHGQRLQLTNINNL